MTTIPDHVGREACRVLNLEHGEAVFRWPAHKSNPTLNTVAKLLMNPPAPMTDPDEEAAKRVLLAFYKVPTAITKDALARATEQMRKEREAWEAGR